MDGPAVNDAGERAARDLAERNQKPPCAACGRRVKAPFAVSVGEPGVYYYFCSDDCRNDYKLVQRAQRVASRLGVKVGL